jgi:hypothetical protein
MRIMVSSIVSDTAMPKAAARLSDERNVSLSPRVSAINLQLTILPQPSDDVCVICSRGRRISSRREKRGRSEAEECEAVSEPAG